MAKIKDTLRYVPQVELIENFENSVDNLKEKKLTDEENKNIETE